MWAGLRGSGGWHGPGLRLVGLIGGTLLMACAPAPAPADPAVTPGPSLGASYSNPPTALAAESGSSRLYVATTGNDDNAGTAAAPLLTIRKAAARADPGTTVIVADGTYDAAFSTRTSGTADARITFVSASKWGAKLVGADDDQDAVWRNYGDYVDIQGFDISGTMTDGLIQTGSYGRIVENRVHGFSEGCISTYKDDYSMVDNDIIGNLVFGCGTTSLNHGIYPGGPGGTISNNIAYGSGGFGIHCWHNCNRQVITNNLVFGNAEGGILVGQGDGPNDGSVEADDMLVANNIAIDNGAQGIRESGATGPKNKFVNNNVVGNGENGIGLIAGSEIGTITDQPDFINFQPDGSGDYRLQPGSPDIDAGTPQGAPAVDIAGATRPQGAGIDIGIYER
jgi:Right handed beta helix region/Protein of unknown function (DUF1565)